MSLSGQWNFSTNAGADWTSIAVPAPWQADERFRGYTGTAWYELKFDVPAEWLKANRVIIVGFGAVDYFSKVWLNEIRIGEHEGGYLPFEFDITRAAQAGTNILTVRVDDPLESFAEVPHGKQSWYGMVSGIWQPVWVESRAADHIERVKISTNGDEISVDVTGRGNLTDGLKAEVIAPDGVTVAQVSSDVPRFSIRVERSLNWSPDEPNLYTLKVSTPEDEVSETFGFRTIETRDGQILLNGNPFYLRGALDQDYYPDSIYTPPSQEYIEGQFRKAKEMGLNCLRIHIKVADPRYYAAADKVGLLIWTELPNHILLSDVAKRRARETLTGMVQRDWNHPSIGIWTIINESWGMDLSDRSQRAWLAETYHWLKELDPTRLVVGNSACWGNFHVATDIADFHIYYAMPDHHQQWREWTGNYARRPWWLFAHEYQGHESWREFSRDPWHASEREISADVERRGDEPLLVSEFGNWGLPDVHKLYDGNNGQEPWWFETGLEWGDGIVYPHGIEERFRQYHFDKVFGSLASLSEASQRLQYDALKYEIEHIRRHKSIQGYVITEFTDVHWECNGLLDMYRNPKTHYAQLKQINRDDLLIPLWEHVSFASDESCTLRVLCSHYSATEIRNATLEWEVIGDIPSPIQGSFDVEQAAPFSVTELGSVYFDVQPIAKPGRAQIKLKLIKDQKVVVTGEQEIFLFPASIPALNTQIYAPEFQRIFKGWGFTTTPDLSSAEVAVTTTLDDSLRDFILRGGRVLFLAERDDALQTHIPGLGIEPRNGTPWQGDWASSFGWHRFKSIPTAGVVNFAFADLTPEHVIHGFSPRDFALDVYAGLFVGWLHKPIPTIARRRAGQGEVLVSTFRLSKQLETNPLAMHLFYELLRSIV
jgi:hypothetical protein